MVLSVHIVLFPPSSSVHLLLAPYPKAKAKQGSLSMEIVGNNDMSMTGIDVPGTEVIRPAEVPNLNPLNGDDSCEEPESVT